MTNTQSVSSHGITFC